MRFLVDSPELPETWPDVSDVYFSGADGRVLAAQAEVQGKVLTCHQPDSESGRLHIQWPVAGFGAPVVSTGSLSEREEPYLLPLELARGKIAQVRDQLSAWEIAGMTIPGTLQEPLKKAHASFRRAAAIQDRPAEASALAAESLHWAFEAARIALDSYAAQRLAARRKRAGQLPAALGCSLGRWSPAGELAATYLSTFTAAGIPADWKHIEAVQGKLDWDLTDAQLDWCIANRLLVYGGPMLDFSDGGLPAWLAPWKNDLANLHSFVCDYVETVAARYVGRIRNWDVCARANAGGALDFPEEVRLSLVARALDVVRQVDDEVQILIRVDQPWGEYQSRGRTRLAPLQFVDALLRAGIGLSAVNLELDVGFAPRSSAHRDLLEVSRMLDLWSGLGVPLHVTLACPSDSKLDDPNADGSILLSHSGSPWNESAQARWVDSILPVLMAKQSIVGIFWCHFSDQVPHEFPNAGLVGATGTVKPVLESLSEQRRAASGSDSDPLIR